METSGRETVGSARCPSARARRRTRAVAVVSLAALLAAACGARGEVGDGPTEDQRITAEVQRILDEDEDIAAEDLQVEVTGGVVVITGVQTDLEAVSEMLARVARVRGVTEVVNRIRILRRPNAPARASRLR